MTTDAERAREIVEAHGDALAGEIERGDHDDMMNAIASALAVVRAEERERAARIAETFVDACDVRTAREIAAEIRAGEKR